VARDAGAYSLQRSRPEARASSKQDHESRMLGRDARHSLDRHATYIVSTFVAGAAR
jgi:hypothetical protein